MMIQISCIILYIVFQKIKRFLGENDNGDDLEEMREEEYD